MKSVVIYSSLTRPELIFGIAKEAIPLFSIFFSLFIFFKAFANYSMLWILPITIVAYLIFFIAAKVDPFYFSVEQKKGILRTKQIHKNKGNYYAS